MRTINKNPNQISFPFINDIILNKSTNIKNKLKRVYKPILKNLPLQLDLFKSQIERGLNEKNYNWKKQPFALYFKTY